MGHDLDVELIKADPELAATILQPLFAAIWEGGEVPADWTKGVIIRIPKKGALSDCNNWRGMRKKQAGSGRERGCTDQIFALRNITEQCTEWQRQLHINIVEFEKAFDRIHTDSLWRILRAYGIPLSIVQII